MKSNATLIYLGKGARNKAAVVRADDAVEEDLLEPDVEVCLGEGHLHPYEVGGGVDAAHSRQVGPVGT